MPPSNDIPFDDGTDDVFGLEPDDLGLGDGDEDALASPVADPQALAAVGARCAEVLVVGLESVLGRQATLAGSAAQLVDFASAVADFADDERISFELRIAVASESYPLAAFISLDDAARLFGIDTSPEQMADGESARAQMEALSELARELLELGALMLFVDELNGGEAALSAIRLGAAEETVAAVASGAASSEALRADVALALADGEHVVINVLMPAALPSAIAAQQRTQSEQKAAREPSTPAARASAGAPRGAASNVSSLRATAADSDEPVHPARFPPLALPDMPAASPQQIDLIMDVSLRITVELGRSSMTVEEVLGLGPGSVVELNKLAGEPVDVLVNDRPIARGEVVVVDENFGVRVTEILSPRSRATALAR